jgi:hypothetical protein
VVVVVLGILSEVEEPALSEVEWDLVVGRCFPLNAAC